MTKHHFPLQTYLLVSVLVVALSAIHTPSPEESGPRQQEKSLAISPALEAPSVLPPKPLEQGKEGDMPLALPPTSSAETDFATLQGQNLPPADRHQLSVNIPPPGEPLPKSRGFLSDNPLHSPPSSVLTETTPVEDTLIEDRAMAEKRMPALRPAHSEPPSQISSLDPSHEPADTSPPPPAVSPDKTIQKTVRLRAGDTLSKILLVSGVSQAETRAAVDALATIFDPRKLKSGQILDLTFSPENSEAPPSHLKTVTLWKDFAHAITVEREGDSFTARAIENDIEHRTYRLGGTIFRSLSQAAYREKVPVNILTEMIDAYSYDVDFQRDIRRKDRFEIMYEEKHIADRPVPGSAKLIYASLHLSGKALPIYRFRSRNGEENFYNEQGESVRKALLRTPVNGARLSSRYGMRKHPILGYNRMHRGVDFAAPAGTPIYAAGSGTIRKAGRNGDYGHYVEIKHNEKFSTAYAHLSRYAKGIRAGTHVKQGQIIGYVGSTGLSSGPHLHFEVLRNGNKINPLSIKLPSVSKLAESEQQDFRQTITEIKRHYDELAPETAMVSREQTTHSR